jgi:signal transduction histidine kinase/ActR/RegA family two-component response regulator
MKTSAQTLPVNGNKKSTKNSKRTQANVGNDFDEPFNLRELLRVLTEVKNENFAIHLPIDEVGLNGKICDTVNGMIANLSRTALKNKNQDWLKSNLAKFTVMLQGQKDLNSVSKKILSELVSVVNAHYGVLYISQLDEVTQTVRLKLHSSYACEDDSKIQKEFSIGEGLVGQCAFEKKRILITSVPKGYVKISSGLGKSKPLSLIISPILFDNKVKAIVELASLGSFSEIHLDFMMQLAESLGAILNTIEAFARTEELLAQAQSQAVELNTQQEELRISNEMLEDKALLLATQNKALAFQNDEKEKRAEELRIINNELAFQNKEKEKRAAELSIANKEVEDSKKSLEEKATQLALTSKYKSEFLANMSHELRSPLNSLLILAQQLYENEEGNLSDKQVRYAKTIHSCGDDLIQLINDILDLSKIESGIISVNTSTIRISEIAMYLETTYKPISEYKNINFSIEIDKELPTSMNTDVLRLNQILKNLLSNAFKFTEKGKVTLRIAESKRQWKHEHAALHRSKKVISFSIQDTGIGIPEEKQLIIFEAFQQAEGSTSRKYGGTGLGLSISRGLIELLGGVIELKSELNRGSTFTLFLPLEMMPSSLTNDEAPLKAKSSKALISESLEAKEQRRDDSSISRSVIVEKKREDELEIAGEVIDETGDDKSNIIADDKIILVIEDDLRFGRIMIEKAHENRMKAIVATSYLEVFDFINRFHPIAITLDVNLPATSGWKVINMLRNDLKYCHIPVHVISGEENRIMALRHGARSFLLKPLENGLLNQLFIDILASAQKATKSILVV